MKKNILTFIFLSLFMNKKFSQTEKINFLNFGVVEIVSENYLDLAEWEMKLITKDTTYSLFEKSDPADSFCFFNITEKVNHVDTIKSDIEIIIKKNSKTIYKNIRPIRFNPLTNFVLNNNNEKINKKIVRGNIIDSYSVICNSVLFSIVRTELKEKYNYWYTFYNGKLINIHSEKRGDKYKFISKIILTDLDKNNKPEFNFFHKNGEKLKLIHLNNLNKIIAYKQGEKIKLPYITKKRNMLEYRGFLYYNLNKISE